MASCDVSGPCFFYNHLVPDKPHTTEYLRKQYCEGELFTECALHWIAKTYGMAKVPKYLYPDDIYEIPDFEAEEIRL